MRQVEDRFNRRFRYQWTFMNDLPFSADFIKYATGMASGPVEFVQIPKKHWDVPNDLNKTLMVDGMQKLVDANIIYGRSISYRKMCRFNSGFFYEQEVLNKFDWYWRVRCSPRRFSERQGADRCTGGTRH